MARNSGSPGAFALHDVRVGVDERWGWAVGESGTIVRLEGSGAAKRWAPDLVASALTHHALYSLDVSADGQWGWAVGEAGTVLRLANGRWRADEAASRLLGQDLLKVVVSDDGARGWAIAGDTGPEDSTCASMTFGEGTTALGPPCGEVYLRDCDLGYDGTDVWLRCTEPCPEDLDDPYRDRPHLWRLGPDAWVLEAKCNEATASLPAPATARSAPGWSAHGRPGSRGQLRKRNADGHWEAQLDSSRGPIIVPGFEDLPLTIERETQYQHEDEAKSSYRLVLVVSHRVSRDRLHAMLEALDRTIMGAAGSGPYARFIVEVTFDDDEHTIATWTHQAGRPSQLENRLLGGTLEQRLRRFLVDEAIDDGYDWPWSGCPGALVGEDEPTVTVAAQGTRGTVVLSTTEEARWVLPECALSIAHKALTWIEEIESLTVRLETSAGTPVIELELDADRFLPLDAVSQFQDRDHELHHLDESGWSRRKQRKARRKIMERWHRNVASKLAPHTLYYRGWDRP
ncbi:MAG: hypothetical protein K0V04_01665 [Deltaproteobacteria bacterium]|nr:hypothetical protein [Deltaproteobacteria bacterium]